MAKVVSLMVPLGTPAHNFALTDVISGKTVTLNDNQKITVIMFICNHCPYVKHVNRQLTQLANDYIPKGVRFIAINSNDSKQYPDDSPEKMKEVSKDLEYPFPYLYDATQEVAMAYNATCTPDFFIYNNKNLLVYRGQLDDSRPGNNIPVTGYDIRDALDKLLLGNEVSPTQKPSMGCSIKWKN